MASAQWICFLWLVEMGVSKSFTNFWSIRLPHCSANLSISQPKEKEEMALAFYFYQCGHTGSLQVRWSICNDAPQNGVLYKCLPKNRGHC